MIRRSLDVVEGQQEDAVSILEHLIQQAGPSIEEARKVLRRFLFRQAGAAVTEGTIGDALALLAKQPVNNSLAAIVLLRCLAVRDLIPEPNATNQIVRSTVELCEGALPEIVSFLKLDSRAQNYEKFPILAGCHKRVTEILSPLASPHGDLDTLLRARREISGCLNHSIVRQYAEPFKLKDVKSTIEAVFGKLKRVSMLDTTLLVDIEECNRAVSNVKAELSVVDSFLSREFLAPFLKTCEKVLSNFLETLRGRFATTITRATGSSAELQKRYPLHEPEREIQIVVTLRNSGPGMATDVRVTAAAVSEHVVLSGATIILGNVRPGDFSVALDAMVISSCKSFQGILSVDWGEIGSNTRKAEMFEFVVVAQSSAIDWPSLEYRTPYTTGVAEGDKFIGRMDKVHFLAAKLLRRPMEPFYITGQKRVGKTSLALAAAEYAKANTPGGSLDYHYVLWGAVAHADPIVSLRQLGESIEYFIQSSLPPGLNAAKGDYNGSLAGLIKLSEVALRAVPERSYVILLDEFDEIHQELFLQGNLAETFFANLRALSRCKNICVVLIGGENMPFIMDRQGQKLNNYSRINLSYFSRTSEWSDFQLIVRTPTTEILNWHDDAVSEIFNITNGNPYFAKIVCASVWRSAVSERDADITASEVMRAIEIEVSVLGANSFAHLWQDGVPKGASEREPDILRRMRVLVAIARSLRQGLSQTLENIARSKTSASLSEAEVPAVLNDFVKRDVLREEDRQYGFSLPIFRLWLVDVGVSQLIADALNEELANSVLAEENSAIVRSDEVVELSRQWPTYRGKHIGTDEVRAWYQQVENARDQRILFKLLKRTRVFSEMHVRERLKNAHAILRPSLPEFVIRKRGERRRDVLLTYIDGEGRSGASYASLYAEENGIAAECVIARSDFRSGYNKHVEKHGPIAALIIMDDIAATGNSLSNNVDKFLSETGDQLGSKKIRIVTLVATETAQSTILRNLEKAKSIDIDFRSCEILPPETFAFPPNTAVWDSEEEKARAKALCVQLGSRIYNASPLGYGGMGLLIVFPTTVPNNSLPILHSYSRTGSGHDWVPLFPRVVN